MKWSEHNAYYRPGAILLTLRGILIRVLNKCIIGCFGCCYWGGGGRGGEIGRGVKGYEMVRTKCRLQTYILWNLYLRAFWSGSYSKCFLRCFEVVIGEVGGAGKIGRGCIMALSKNLKSLVEQVLCKDCFISLSLFFRLFLIFRWWGYSTKWPDRCSR